MSEAIKELKDKLLYKRVKTYEVMTEADMAAANEYAKGYMAFLDGGKTERECVSYTIKMVEAQGYVEYKLGDKIEKGGKYYYNNRGRAIYVFRIGSENVEEGIRISASHIDSPRLDLKPHPLYEDNGVGYLKTHYYGGVKKYQWVAMPLALHGTVIKADGTSVDIIIGEDDSDPVFYISDLLPHLAKDQMARNAREVIPGEKLNLMAGTLPLPEAGGEGVKLALMKLLYEKYGIVEADFISAELEVVPAFKAREIGLDRSLIGAYGHDDRVCSYPILTAAVEASKKTPAHTLITILADKEETGSNGNTGMKSQAFDDMLREICVNMGANERLVYANSRCLSADVNACYDPNYAEVYEAKNSAFLNCGVCVTKFTGSGGKSSTNDASAEYMAEIRDILDNAEVSWQTGELGKVDQGGGGTVAYMLAQRNIETVDIGVPVLSMHAPYEVISKSDLYAAYKAFSAFFAR